MKSLKSCLLIAVLCLSTGFVPSAFPSSVRPVRGIDVVVQKDPGNSASRQTATANSDGTVTVKLPGPGTYKISYADGPNKGKVTATKAGPVSFKNDAIMNSIRNIKS